MTYRIAVGRVFHESNSFNPEPTKSTAFEWLEGQAVLENARATSTTLGGIVRRLDAADADLIPLTAVSAPPSGLVEPTVYAGILRQWLDILSSTPVDALAIEMHGAMATLDNTDADGHLLGAVRDVIGNRAVLGVGLDLHAHVTAAMLTAADICIACKQNPHSDMVECGERVAELVLDVLKGDLEPVTVMAKTRMILPGANETDRPPLSDLHAAARELEASRDDVRDVSLFNVFRFLDADDIGQAAVILSNGADPDLERTATGWADDFWKRRDEFVDELVTVEDALNLAARPAADRPGGLPYVMADMGDRVLAGAPGDGTFLLDATLQDPRSLHAAFTVTDPVVARQLHAEHAVGDLVSLRIGGGITPGFKSIAVEGRVTCLADGRFAARGPYQADEVSSHGPCAVLRIADRIDVLINTKAGLNHDPNAFTSFGIELDDKDFVVVKSGYHFVLNYDGLATPMLVATAGVSRYAKGVFDRKRGPFWPEHDVSSDPFMPVRTFARTGRAET